MKAYVIQSKYGTMMNVSVSIWNKIIGLLAKTIICGILVHVIVSVIGHVKLTNIQILKIAHVEKYLIGKLELLFQDEILNATETSLDIEKSSI